MLRAWVFDRHVVRVNKFRAGEVRKELDMLRLVIEKATHTGFINGKYPVLLAEYEFIII